MNFISLLFITTINNKFILNLNCYISRFEISFAYKINNVENVI